MDYSPYSDIRAVYDAKIAWGKATTAEEKQAQSDIAANARKNLEANGYGYIASAIGASSATASNVKTILDQWSPVTGAPSTKVDNPAYETTIAAATKKNNAYNDTILKDHENINSKYNDLFDYANQDITGTDEYKSAYKNIMPSYTLSALKGRENEVASGSGSNGGNVDSFAAANALRQQTEITAKGQALAHQVGLESYATRIDKANSVLSNLGIYNSGVYSAMSDSVNNDLNIANSIFTNAETAKNNEVSRLSQQAAVTGYVPKQWQYSNNPYFNADGTLNEIYTSADFDATGGFTTIINNAKAKLATTTDANERANLQATIDYATQAKAYKTLGNPYYAQWAHEVEAVTPARTAEYDLTNKQIESAERISSEGNETALEQLRMQLASNEKVTAAQIDAAIKQAQAQGDAQSFGKGQMDTLLSVFSFDTDVSAFITNELSKLSNPSPGEITSLIVGKSEYYNIDVDDAKVICRAYGVSTNWLDDYTDRTDADGTGKTHRGEGVKGSLRGMKKK